MNDQSDFTYRVYTDGGSRGNPGPAAYGFVVYDPANKLLHEAKHYLGVTTNNQAEYQGLVAALEYLQSIEWQLSNQVVCYSDSQLMVRQVNGQYKMKSDELRPWLERILSLKQSLPVSVQFVDVRREQNKYADRLVNQALDEVTHGKA